MLLDQPFDAWPVTEQRLVGKAQRHPAAAIIGNRKPRQHQLVGELTLLRVSKGRTGDGARGRRGLEFVHLDEGQQQVGKRGLHLGRKFLD